MWHQLAREVNGKWSHTRCGRCQSVLINFTGFHCFQKARHKVFIITDEMCCNQAIFHELQKVTRCEEISVLVGELLEKLPGNATLSYELLQSLCGCMEIRISSELMMVLDQLRYFLQKKLWINKHNIW